MNRNRTQIDIANETSFVYMLTILPVETSAHSEPLQLFESARLTHTEHVLFQKQQAEGRGASTQGKGINTWQGDLSTPKALENGG
jgi:hypothetical protein